MKFTAFLLLSFTMLPFVGGIATDNELVPPEERELLERRLMHGKGQGEGPKKTPPGQLKPKKDPPGQLKPKPREPDKPKKKPDKPGKKKVQRCRAQCDLEKCKDECSGLEKQYRSDCVKYCNASKTPKCGKICKGLEKQAKLDCIKPCNKGRHYKKKSSQKCFSSCVRGKPTDPPTGAPTEPPTNAPTDEPTDDSTDSGTLRFFF